MRVYRSSIITTPRGGRSVWRTGQKQHHAPLEPTHGDSENEMASNKWDAVQMAPADPILGVAVAFRKDTHPQKVPFSRSRGSLDLFSLYRVEMGKLVF